MAMTQRAARDLVADITAAHGEGDHETAARLAAWGVEAFPDAAVFHRLRGVALAALGSHDEATEDLHTALATDPLDHETLVALARIEEAEGDLYTAAEHLLTAWEHDPANGLLRSDLTYRLARLYGSEGYLQYTRPALAALYVRNAYPERAAREYAAALAEQPNRTDLRLASALARWRLGALAEAADGCVLLLAEQPNLVRARWALADALARRGRGDEARDHAKHAALLDPDGAIARAMIEGNPDATIVDPDEMVRVPLDAARPVARSLGVASAEMPVPAAPPSATDASLHAVESLPAPSSEPLAEPPPVDETPISPPAALFASSDDETVDTSLIEEPAMEPPTEPPAPDPEFTARANAELDTFEQTLAALERTLAALNAANASRPAGATEDAPPTEAANDTIPPAWEYGPGDGASTPPAPGAGDVAAVADGPPGDASPPAIHAPREEAAHAGANGTAPATPVTPEPVASPSAVPPQPDEEPEPVIVAVTEAGDVLADRPGAEPLLEDADALPDEDAAFAPLSAAPEPSFARAPAAVASPSMSEVAPAGPQRVAPSVVSVAPVALPAVAPEALLGAVRERVAAGDTAGAIAVGRASLVAAGKETAHVRALLPAIRALVEAAPDRPDARRLLGDTYRRLGQMSQAQGQYQQALLVRVAGKK